LIERPDLMTIGPYMILPLLVAVLLGVLARRRGATWTQIQVSLGAGLLGAFMTSSGWVFAAYINGDPINVWMILGSQILVGLVCALAAFFSTMPTEQDLTDKLQQYDRRK